MEFASASVSVKYHDIFGYKLTKEEAIKWQYKNQKITIIGIKNKLRLQREKYSQKKLKIAKKASELISKIPTVLFVGITGSLAMMNADKNSDIDLMIITKKNTLWVTRIMVYLVLRIMNYELRNPNTKKEKDKLCMNLWLDEQDLIWDKRDRNIYTAHEIAQIIPLVNKNNIYEKFLYLNRWILNYWPKAVKIRGYLEKMMSPDSSLLSSFLHILNIVCFKLQHLYMKPKMTREIVAPTHAIFHPNNWGEVVIKKLSK
jgi:predicted nucleotidyltransferase